MTDAEQGKWFERIEQIPPRKPDLSTWPPDVRPISLDEMNALGVDTAGMVYWHGKPLQIRRKLELRTVELTLLATATLGALLQGVAAMFPFVPPLISKSLGY
jgi:hypothetical protein